MENLAVLILAAGLGKRMGGALPKVLSLAAGKPLITHVLRSVAPLNPQRTVIITGYKRELVEAAVAEEHAALSTYGELGQVSFAYQAEQLGTGHAARCALPLLDDFEGLVLILYGDVPRIRSETLRTLLASQRESQAALTVLTFFTQQPNAYGRIVRAANGSLSAIIEAKDCDTEQRKIKECNSGIYLVAVDFLKEALLALENKNAQGEFYLTDIVSDAVRRNLKTATVQLPEEDEVQGVNDTYELQQANQALLEERLKQLVLSGVRITDLRSVYIEEQVQIAKTVSIGPNVQLLGNTIIEDEVSIEGTCWLKNVTVKSGAKLKLGVRAEDSVIGERAQVGPFAHLREGSLLGADSRVGNFVETKKTELGQGAKASHLTYLGNCSVGAETNIGAGTITCNYDGYKKSKTTIGKRVFVGSNTALVAPVTIHDGAAIGAGSVITKDVEADSLALTRPKLETRPGWAKSRRELHQSNAAGKK